MATISRNEYVGLFGPTVGDRIRLGDTGLFVEIERDLRGAPGDEIVFGGGKSLREGMGMDNRITRAGGAPDLVITNVTIIDAVLGRGEGRRRHQGRAHLRASARPATRRRWTASRRGSSAASPPTRSRART